MTRLQQKLVAQQQINFNFIFLQTELLVLHLPRRMVPWAIINPAWSAPLISLMGYPISKPASTKATTSGVLQGDSWIVSRPPFPGRSLSCSHEHRACSSERWIHPRPSLEASCIAHSSSPGKLFPYIRSYKTSQVWIVEGMRPGRYNGEYFQQHEGTAMGNSLSPFIANLFMSKFETNNFVAKLNNRFPTIKFTYEVEHNEQLPFLDVLVIRNSENKLEFDVYRKETATLRYIPNDSHHPFQHKMASFNFLIHRLLNFPLSKERFEHEKQLIKNIAKSNGYSVHLIDKLIRKHKFKRTLYNSTTFRRDTDNSKFASLPYEPKFTRGLDKIFKNININLVYNSKNKLQTLLGNPKDKINHNEKSGIYEISCKDCDQKYIGQTKRSILTRFKEHMAHLKYGRTEKSCVAQHAFDNNHRIDINNLKLIRNVTNSRQLDAFESLEIIKCNNSMNKDNGPIPTSPLFALINKDSYGSVNRGNKFGINSANRKDKFEYFPRVWFRYVDDIFAVFNTKAISLDNFVAKLNNRFPTIKFTYEVEHNEQLPFLDVLVIRNSENKLEFDVYRKETATLRYISND
ncbi:hypothetical protein NQ318_002294 [Aromia moschata]|uniref:GIY-YIG domain-containing protein n=1 Tax=Aromia moschata TaxID=1265417 RepID=A0AAV8Z351_9CUCU|nr:hypothetical protein NQ318_002294 [Aromia moschata]